MWINSRNLLVKFIVLFVSVFIWGGERGGGGWISLGSFLVHSYDFLTYSLKHPRNFPKIFQKSNKIHVLYTWRYDILNIRMYKSVRLMELPYHNLIGFVMPFTLVAIINFLSILLSDDSKSMIHLTSRLKHTGQDKTEVRKLQFLRRILSQQENVHSVVYLVRKYRSRDAIFSRIRLHLANFVIFSQFFLEFS